jgi:hypothetical protein
MPRVQIHCYGCDATVPVATARSTEDLSRAGWWLAGGETYCPVCAPARVPTVPTGPGENVEASSGDGAATTAASDDLAKPSPRAGFASSVLGGISWPRFPRAGKRAAERHLPRLRPAATLVVTAMALPFRRPRAPLSAHSQVSSQTIVLFCLAAVLTLATLGSNDMAVRLPGVVCAFAAGLSWLHDLRSRS